MKCSRTVFIALSLSLTTSAWPVMAQEVQTTEPAKPNPDTKVVEAPALPPIPLTVISRVPWNIHEADRLGLTKVKREELTAFISAHNQETSQIQRLLTDLDQARLKNFRFQIAITELVDEANSKAHVKAQTFFTAEQLAKLRQAHRQEIQQASFTTRKVPLQPNAILMPPLDTALANHDLLSILELPEIQQALSIDDEQWQKIEVAKQKAATAARQLILVAAKKEPTPVPAVDPDGQRLFEKLLQDTLQLLNEKQRLLYQELVQERQKKFQAPPAKGEPMRDFKLIMPHGVPTASRSFIVGTESTIQLTLHNAFADPEVIQRLQLDETQQQDIADKLEEFKPVLAKRFQEQQQVQLQKDQGRQQKLREIVLAHNVEFEKPLAEMLTEDQHARLKKECLKSLGLGVLLKPEVAQQLQLTDAQLKFIAAQLNKPAPAMPQFGAPNGSFEAFKKQSEDFHRQMTEHHMTMTAAVWGKLTSEQRTQLEELTGLKQPPKLHSAE